MRFDPSSNSAHSAAGSQHIGGRRLADRRVAIATVAIRSMVGEAAKWTVHEEPKMRLKAPKASRRCP